jgi:HSP20 family protein
MRLRYKLVTYHFGEDQANQQSLQRHYRELMDELLRQGQHHAVAHQTVQWRPAADIHETTDAILVKMELAGMREEDIEVTLYEDALVVSGRREDDVARDSEVYFHEAQIRYGPFRAEILLPGPVERERVEARYENGFLHVMLPKVTDPLRREKAPDVSGSRRTPGASQPLQASAASKAADVASPVAAQPAGPAAEAAPLPAATAGGALFSAPRGGLRDA